ncbi:MAG: hypothetical protein GX154_08560 [Clostridiales bacterium]|nr:hypothetical protein [Clostridiales bacterium]
MFISKSSEINIKTRLGILYTFNLLDLVFSYAGLKACIISEANPIVKIIYKASPFVFVLWKVIIPLTLIVVIDRLIELCINAKVLGLFVTSVTAVYGFIILLHFRWIYLIYK